MSKTQKALYIALLVGLGVMLAMWYMDKNAPLDAAPAPATKAAPGGARPAGPEVATAPAPETVPATGPAPLRVAAETHGSPPAGLAAGPTTDPAKESTTGPAPETAPTTGTAPTTAPEDVQWTFPRYPAQEVLLGTLDPRTGYRMQVKVVSAGAAVETVKLSEYFNTVADKRRFDKDPDSYPQAEAEDAKLAGHYTLMSPIGGEQKVYPLATPWISLWEDSRIDRDLSGSIWRVLDVRRDAGGVARAVTLAAQVDRNGEPHVRIEKTYSLPDPADYPKDEKQRRLEGYSLRVELKAINLTGRPVTAALTQYGGTGMPVEDFRADDRVFSTGRFKDKKFSIEKVPIKKIEKLEAGLASAKSVGFSTDADAALWIGEGNRYFATAGYVVPPEGEALAAPAAKANFLYAIESESGGTKTFLPLVVLGRYEIAPGGSAGATLDVFAGPKRRDLLSDNPLYGKLSYIDLLDLKSCFCGIDALALMVMWLLDAFSKVLLGNYGLAIILLVVLTRLVLHPVTKRSQVSMMKMQKFQPQIEALKEKYKNDKERLNKEIAGFYKQHGATPILGCLPMFLQMPIWIALWTGIQAAVELRHAGLLPVWINDLAAPDALIGFGGWSFKIPWLSDGMGMGPIRSFNLLPILLAVAMALQQKYTPSAAPSAGGGQQAKTQKQMMGFMTVFFLLMFYNAPSGLTLYIMASTFAGVAEQIVIRKHIKEKEAAEAATETQVAMPGKHFRGQKPKKPKPPFRTK